MTFKNYFRGVVDYNRDCGYILYLWTDLQYKETVTRKLVVNLLLEIVSYWTFGIGIAELNKLRGQVNKDTVE